MNGATPEQQQQDLDNLKQSSDSYRQRLYKQIGVDPNKGPFNLTFTVIEGERAYEVTTRLD